MARAWIDVYASINQLPLTTFEKHTRDITEYSLRHFIKDRGIGCVGWQVHFRNGAVQVSEETHIRREWFHVEDMDALDECMYYFNL